MANGGSSNPQLTNVTFSGNYADRYGGGMYSWMSEPMLTNVTFGGNRAGSAGGGMCNSDSSPTLVNCIVWGNSPDSIFNYDLASSPMVSYNDIENGYTGPGNINLNRLFVAPVAASEAPTTAGNYRLRQGSPCIDAGFDDAVTIGTDLDGNPRIADGDGDGEAIVDMGAYEFLPKVYLPLVLRGY